MKDRDRGGDGSGRPASPDRRTLENLSGAAGMLPEVYAELRALASRYMQGERRGHTLQPTALVHEAYLRLVDINRTSWKGKTHFFAVAAVQMRRVLVDHARAAKAAKRPRRGGQVTLHDAMALTPEQSIDLVALDESLTKLARANRRQSQVAEMRLFAGMLVSEIAGVLDISERTVKRDWLVARAWLADDLGAGPPAEPR